LGCIVKVTSPIIGPAANRHSRCASTLFAVALCMEESADADLRVDLLGGDFHLKLGGVAAITFARTFCV